MSSLRLEIDEKVLAKLADTVDRIGTETGHGDISLHQIKTLLFVARRDLAGQPADQREIADGLRLSTSGVSRAIASLGHYGRGDRSGLGLVETKPSLSDRRRKPVVLTRKGLSVLSKILSKG